MRLFIAIKLNRDTKIKLNTIQKTLGKHTPGTKWVKPENIHMTLRFIGKTNPDKIKALKQITVQVAEKFNKFITPIKGFNFFPNFIKARVFYLKVEDPEPIINIAQDLNQRLRKIGLPPHKHFRPHLTLARLKTNKDAKIISHHMPELEIKQEITIDNITLYESKLRPAGAVHEELLSSALK